MATIKEYKFLAESNAIEDVWDDDSLLQAVKAWNYLKKQPLMTLGVILKTHKILMLHQKLRPDEKGYFRKRPVWIGGREGVPYSDIPMKMGGWCFSINSSIADFEDEDWPKPKTDWEYQAKLHHIAYEKIHPFIDGNGRTGRMFLNWHRLRLGLPILIIEEAKKGDYYKWFAE